MPLGNGDIGANVWVEPSGDLVLLLSKTDAYDDFGRLLKLGRIRIKLDPPLSAPPFQQTLRMENGSLEIRSNDAQARVWVDAHHPVIQIEAESETPLTATVQNEVWRTEVRRVVRETTLPGTTRVELESHSAYGNRPEKLLVYPDVILPRRPDQIAWCHHNIESIWEANLRHTHLESEIAHGTDPLLKRTFGVIVRGAGLKAVADTELQSERPAKSLHLQLYALTRFADTPSDWLAAAEARADEVPASVTDRFAAHEAWWRQYWNRSWIEVSSAHATEAGAAHRVTEAYAIQRFIHGCTGRGSFPIKFNGAIFTVDEVFDPDYRRWGGGFWFQNTRLPYWAMYLSDDYDLFAPFFDFYMAALPLRRNATRRYFGHDGAFYPETVTPWGNTNDVNYGLNRGDLPPGITENQYIRRHWDGGIELVGMMLDYYDSTLDSGFRDEVLVPMAREIMAAYDQHWQRGPDGKILYHPSQSLETWWDCTNPTPTVAGLRYLLPRLLELPVDEALKAAWRRQLADQPELPTETKDGKTRILPAATFANRKNIETPELYAIFPFRLHTRMAGGEAWQIGLHTWHTRSNRDKKEEENANVGWQQQPIMAALLGLSDEAKVLLYERVKTWAAGYRFPGFFGPDFDWTPSEDHINVFQIALQFMLMQCEGDRILLLPAWPVEWNARFKLHAPRQTTVEAEVRGGSVVRLVVQPASRRRDVEICPPFRDATPNA